MRLTQPILLIISLLCLFNPITHAAEELDYIVAIVNENVVVNTEFQQEIRTAAAKLREQGIRVPRMRDFEKQVLENLIMKKLQLQLAQRTGIKVDDTTLNTTLRRIAGQNNLSLDEFRQAIEKDGFSFVQFREDVRSEMIIHRLQQRQVVSRINVSEKEIDNLIVNKQQQGVTNQEFLLWHILIATPEAAAPAEIEQQRQTAEAVLNRLKAGEDFQETAVLVSDSRTATEGGNLGWLAAGEVPSLFIETVAQMEIGQTSELIRNASGFHILKLADKRGGEKSEVTQTLTQHILIETNELVSDLSAQARLADIKQRVENGESFAELAKAHSDDSASAAEGGQLGWVMPGRMVPEFEQAMLQLASGQLSEPFKSRFGWHLVQVLDRRQQDNTEQAQRTEAMQQIRQRKIEEELQSWLRQLRDEAYVEYRLAGMESA